MRFGSQSTDTARYSGTSSSPPPPRYATWVPISGWGARPAAHTSSGAASVDDTHGVPVHGHASAAASEALLSLRYSGPAPPSLGAPSPVVSSSSSSTGPGSGIYKSGQGLVLASPIPQTLRPQMAILLNDRAAAQQQQSEREDSDLRRPTMMYPDPMWEAAEDDAIEEGFLSREKKHGCTMCHKRFDRPSTLKKHLLVHTGEKAFQCSICERRFGVMSNLNRHIRRCSLREVHTHGSAASHPPASLPDKSAPVVTAQAHPPLSHANAAAARPRPPAGSRLPPLLQPPRARSHAPRARPPAPRLPQPRPSPRVVGGRQHGPQWDEERDSWDENVGSAPYHPRDWEKTHRLPGPGVVKFGGAIGGNYSGGSGSEFGFGGGGVGRVRAVLLGFSMVHSRYAS
ncbi:hypothetical protein B0H12DRAFT_1324295 [Mycena haematopus]|nr:hypothetical protein B0H12DRAFT_1324295 [Mycena haematopus]